MRSSLLYIIVVLCSLNTAISQETFVKRISIEESDLEVYQVHETEHNTFMLYGAAGESSIFMEIGPGGNIINKVSFDASDIYERIEYGMIDSDGMLIGTLRSRVGLSGPAFIFKFDIQEGEMVWLKRFVLEQDFSTFQRIIEIDSAGNHLLCGQISGDGLGGDAILMEIDRLTGDFNWQKIYDLGSIETFMEMIENNDKLYFTGRYNFSGGGTNRMRIGITKLDMDRNQDWSRLYLVPVNTDARMYSRDIVRVESDLLVTGFGNPTGTSSAGYEFQFLSVDTLGNINFAFHGNSPEGEDFRGQQVIPLEDGYLISGQFESNSLNRQIMLNKLNFQGELIWSKQYGGLGDQGSPVATIIKENKIHLFGLSAEMGQSLIYYLKLNMDGSLDESCPEVNETEFELFAYDSPYNEQHSFAVNSGVHQFSDILPEYTSVELQIKSCGSILEEDCSNGIDDDEDGQIDCYDDDCPCTLEECEEFCCEEPISYWSLDACDAGAGETDIYEEFEAEFLCDLPCSDVNSSIIFREPANSNRHSCTPGFAGVAMCVGGIQSCTYVPGADQSVVFEVVVSPDEESAVLIERLSFYQKAPEEFDWINGETGPNNYPTLYGLRILKNNIEVYLNQDISTSLDWSFEEFQFDDLIALEECTFRFELLSYCTADNGGNVFAWDLDEIKVFASCVAEDNFQGNVFGKISQVTSAGLDGVDVILLDEHENVSSITLSKNSGAFVFYNQAFDDYTLLPISGNEDYREGLSTYDLVRIQGHLLGRTAFQESWEFIAADANGDQKVSATDISSLKKLLLGSEDFLAVDSWTYCSHLPGVSNPFDFERKIKFTSKFGENIAHDFMSIKIGDLNPSFLDLDDRDYRNINILVKKTEQDEYFFYEFFLDQELTMMGIQLSLSVEGSSFQFLEGIVSKKDINTVDDQIHLSQASAEEKIITPEDRLFSIEIPKKYGTETEVSYKLGSRLSAEIYDHTYAKINISEIIQLNTLMQDEILVYPNPFSEQARLVIENEKECSAIVNVYSTNGRFLHQVVVVLNKGRNIIPIDFDEFDSGLYILELKAEDLQYTFKVIKE